MPTSRADVRSLARLAPGTPALALEANIRLVQAYGAMVSTMDAYLLPFDLNSSRFAVMRLLYQAAERRLTMGQIRRELSVTSTNVSRLVDTLERRGFVRRLNGANDRRVVNAQMTAEGERVFLAAAPGVLERITAFWRNVDPAAQEVAVIVLAEVWHAANSVRTNSASAKAPDDGTPTC